MINDTPVQGPFGAGTRAGASIADQIKNHIFLNRLRPGDPLPTETELCAMFGVSRSGVREAVRTLAALDIVEVRHGHGTFVGQLSLAPLVEGLVFRGVLGPGDHLATLHEVVEVRVALDLALTDQVVAALHGTTEPGLDTLVEEMEAAARRGETFLDADRRFHSQLVEPVDNTLVGQLVTAFWDVHSVVYPMLGLTPPAQLDETARAHGDMLRAARAGDADAYRAAVLEHYAPLRAAIAQARAARDQD